MSSFLALVAQDIKQRFGTDLSNIAVVFNNKRPITYLKKHLADTYGHAIWSPQFFTIQEFFSLASEADQVSQLTQFFYLYELHNELLVKEGHEPETLEEFYPIAEIILSDFSQLDYDLVNIDHIYMELFDTSKIDIEFQHLTKEQQDFIKQFWQSFNITGHTGVQERFLKLWKRLPVLYRAFKEKLAAHNHTNFPTIYRQLAEGELDNKALTDPYQQILFVGFNALNNAEATLFKNWQEKGKALFYFDADTYYLDDNQQEAGLFIRRNILQNGLLNALGEAPNIIGNRSDTIHLYASTGKINQTKLLYDILVNNEQAEKTSAILLADESLLVPLLQSLPETKVNITTGFPLIQSPIFGIMDLWMKTQEQISHQKKTKITYQDVETFLNNPLTKISATEKMENQKFINEKQLFEINIEDIQIKSSVLPNFFKPLSSTKEVIPTLIHILDLLLASLAQDTQIKQIDANLLIETKKVLNQLHLGFEKIPELSILFQIGLIRKAIAPINSAIEGDPLEGLQIMGLLESRCLNFDNIYILGANEGILPKTSNAATFLPNTLRKAYGLPILENQDALSAYLFYRHLQYSNSIHLFYNSIVDESSSGEESRFIRQLEFESKFNFIKKQQQQPILFPPQEEELIIPKSGDVWNYMRAKYIEGKAKISATALTTYLQSPLQFFFKHVAEIKEPPRISQEFEMNLLGTVIHNVMETILKPLKGLEDFTPTKQLLEKVNDVDGLVLLEIARQYNPEIKEINELNSLQRIMHKIATEYIKMYLEYDAENFQAIRIIELENDKDYSIDFPIVINGKEEVVQIYGIIDRVDEVVTDLGEVKKRIVDYKTGGDSVKFSSIEKVFSSNTENKALVQTLFYAYVFEQKTGIKDLEPNLYVARKMREEGTIFHGSRGAVMQDEFLTEQKNEFVKFMQETLEEIFNTEIPFKHNPDAQVYETDPYTLFYRNAINEEEETKE
ncbi:PD-(D/E)XK nuclease family protein [Sphingobacterium bovistauri]|uniref:PD-(D/E)XK nuclease family protein n=1 Tax=Sphingobacterium bovistauri TaxID=2781959 RepID=A0ABS7Z2H7_9SPHI|nr:PD-(D/E)XK nuclease family protein [Sphingobacterium bovistauri]MCA5004363.1 PD-(D/E)XK nuclease family protein [Sphingobacterium bovistauri]